MNGSRRIFLKTAGAAGIAAVARISLGAQPAASRKRHIITLSFDDGFRKSFLRTAEIHEKHGIPACLTVLAAGSPAPEFLNEYTRNAPLGDFGLWNELQSRGHEIMPHGFAHENLQKRPFDQAQELIRKCLAVFSDKLAGFDPKQAVFNFPYNASTPELERWLPTQVRAFRTGNEAVNRWPHKGQVKLSCNSFGPGNAEAAIDREIENLLARETGWLIFNTHGLDGEGWGPIHSTYLERLLERLLAIETVEVLPAGRALLKYVS